jgi:hypothetical protein
MTTPDPVQLVMDQRARLLNEADDITRTAAERGQTRLPAGEAERHKAIMGSIDTLDVTLAQLGHDPKISRSAPPAVVARKFPVPNVNVRGAYSAGDEASDKTPAAGVELKPATLPRTSGSGITKRRAFVEDPDDGTKVASSLPVALNDDGSMKAAGLAPDILVRRVNRAIPFSQFFGTPTR